MYFDSDSDDDEPVQIIYENIFRNCFTEEFSSDDFRGNVNLIKLDKKDLKQLLGLIEATEENFNNGVKYLFESNTYKDEFIVEILSLWHTEEFIVDYYRSHEFIKEDGNKWFFKIVNLLNPLQRNSIIEKYFNNTLDDSVELNINDNMTLEKMSKKNYERKDGEGFRIGEILTDLRRSCVYVMNENKYFIKIETERLKKCDVIEVKINQFKDLLKGIYIGEIIPKQKSKSITLYDIFNSCDNRNYITKREIMFYSNNKDVFSYFQGYQFDIFDEFNEENLEIINPFLNYVKHIICNDNEDIFYWVINWVSYIFKNPNGKTNSCIILIGQQGAGKNTFGKIICHLLGKYGNDNSNLKNIASKNNSSILNKKLIICNEVEDKKDKYSSRLKTLITEDKGDIDKKYANTETMESNVVNLMILSNSEIPINIEENDRRYLVIKVNNELANNSEYFANLQISSLSDEFFNTLLSFFVHLEIKDWDRFKPPMTPAKEFIINYTSNPFKIFIKLHLTEFKKGFDKTESHAIFNLWRNSYKSKFLTLKEYDVGIQKYCNFEAKNSRYKLKVEFYQIFSS